MVELFIMIYPAIEVSLMILLNWVAREYLEGSDPISMGSDSRVISKDNELGGIGSVSCRPDFNIEENTANYYFDFIKF